MTDWKDIDPAKVLMTIERLRATQVAMYVCNVIGLGITIGLLISLIYRT